MMLRCFVKLSRITTCATTLRELNCPLTVAVRQSKLLRFNDVRHELASSLDLTETVQMRSPEA